MKEQLQLYLEQLEQEHKEYRKKYRTEQPRYNCFQYDRYKTKDINELKNIKEQKLHIKRLIKLIEERESK